MWHKQTHLGISLTALPSFRVTPCKVKIDLSGSGSGCASVGRVVASDTRGPRFESSHRRNF